MTLGLGETILFSVCAVLAVASALGVSFAKKPVHAALAMLGVMVPLACLYIAQNAVFLGVTQIVVYSGAIMMMFLFVIMLIGTHNWSINTKGPKLRLAAVALSIAFVALITGVISLTSLEVVEAGSNTSNPLDIALSIFNSHYFTMQISALLLVSAAMGALLLTHNDKKKKISQKQMLEAKMRAYAENNSSLNQKTVPGVYASSNASNMENISGETGEVIEDSVFDSYKASGQVGKHTTLGIEIIDGSTGEKQ